MVNFDRNNISNELVNARLKFYIITYNYEIL